MFLNPQARKWALIGVVIVLLGVIAAVVAARAEAYSVKPAGTPRQAPVPCRSCHYWASAANSTFGHDGIPITLRAGAEYVVYRTGQVHVMTVAYSGEDSYGPFAFDRVTAFLRIANTKEPIAGTYVGTTPRNWWEGDGTTRWGQKYLGRKNGRTVNGIELVVDGYWGKQHVRTVVDPSQMVGPDASASAR